MQFVDLKTQYIRLKAEIDQSIQAVLDNADFIMGPQVKELERQLADYVGVKHCISCANGTDALTLALMTYDIKAGDAVFVPTFTFYSTAETVSLRGATPIFVDIVPDTYNISCASLREAIQSVKGKGQLNPKAIIAVDLFGLPADFTELCGIADEYGLKLIEDGAQGFGGSINGQKACSFGDIATTSFFPAKPLGCYGDGGAVFTDNDVLCSLIQSYRVHGKGEDKYDNLRVGLNSRLDTLQAAILMPKLKAFREYELEARNRVADQYRKGLKDCLAAPQIPEGYISSYAQYSVLLKNERQRDWVQQGLQKNGIPTMIYYRKSMHQQTVYQDNPSIDFRFPIAEDISRRILNLPLHPYLEEKEQLYIIETIRKLCDQTNGGLYE